MDPALFRIDWEVLAEVLATVTVLAFFIERALSLLFEHRLFVTKLSEKGLKEPIALFVSFLVVRYWNFDAVGIFMHADKTSLWGYLITAAIIAGGSKASIKLFQDVMDAKSGVLREKLKTAEAEKK